MSTLVNDNGELRSGWKFAVYLLLFFVFLFATGAAISILANPSIVNSEIGFLGINAIALTLPAVLTLLFMIRFVDHVPRAAYGTGRHEGMGHDFLFGLLIAAGMLILFGLASAAAGGLTIENAPHGDGFWGRLIVVVILLGVSAFNEELVFRGYPMQVLMTGIGPLPAIVVMSGLFGLLHHLNPNATWLGTLNVVLAGVLLSLAYLRTRSLWFPFGIHVGWNLGLGPIFGFPVSGLTIGSIWNSQSVGADWVTGGDFGPEGGVLGTLAIIVAIIAVQWTRAVDVSPTLRTLLLAHSNKVYARGFGPDVVLDKSAGNGPRARVEET